MQTPPTQKSTNIRKLTATDACSLHEKKTCQCADVCGVQTKHKKTTCDGNKKRMNNAACIIEDREKHDKYVRATMTWKKGVSA